MIQSEKWDYIIAGGGLSGLTLALKMQEKLSDFKTLIVDQDRKEQDDRTWSYWTDKPQDLPDIAYKNWEKIKIHGVYGERILDIAPYRYYTVRGKDFYDYAKNKLHKDSRFTFLTDRIVSVDPPTGTVHTQNHGAFSGQWVFKSYFQLKEIPQVAGYHLLYQQFKGWIIETPTAHFDPQTLTLMDFRSQTPSKDIRFNYVLPFSERTALVEYTAFTPALLPEATLESHLQWYVEKVLQIKSYTIQKTEHDAIPMTDYPFRPHSVGKVIHIGTIGAYVKGSSGYCYTRTFEKINRLVNDLKAAKDVRKISYASPAAFRLFDSVLLDIMQQNEVPADLIFSNFYSKINHRTLFSFLDEKANPLEVFQVMLASPGKRQFIASILRKLSRFSKL